MGFVETDDEEARARVGRTVGGKWRLERLLGVGGMAAVYAATGTDGTRAALKLLHPEMARRRDVRERFLREAYLANKVGHPGTVRVLEHGANGEAFLVMELLEGTSLGERVARDESMTVRDLLLCADQLLDVLVAAHAQGIVHRDIKPDNVFITHDGRARLLDFGIARVLDDVPGEYKTRTGLALGTVPYMAPEQALGRRDQLDGRADLFALGALLFRVLAGRRIHEEPSEAELLVAMATRPAPKLESVAPAVPRMVCAIVDLALAFSRDARYPDARTMQQDVQAVLEGREPPFVVGGGVLARRDAPTRMERSVDPAAVAAPALAREAPPTVASAAQRAVQPTLPDESIAVPASVAPWGAAAQLEQMPHSAAPTSLGAMVAAQAPPISTGGAGATASSRRGSRGLPLALAFAGGGVILLGVVGLLAALVLRPWEATGALTVGGAPSASGVAGGASNEPGGASAELPRPGDPTSSADPPSTAAKPSGNGSPASAAKPIAKPAPAAAPTSPAAAATAAPTAATAAATTTAPAATPKPTSSPSPPASTGGSSSKEKGKGHDKDEHKGKGHHK